MSSLCCAIATQRLTALCHDIAAQITAFLLSSMPMHPKQNLAAANRYGAPLFLRKSHQRFSLPFLRLACLCFSVPLHSSSPHSLCLCCTLLRTFLCYFSLCFAVAKHVDAKLCRCHAPLSLALPLQLNAELFRCNSAPCFAKPRLAVQFLRHASPCHASANQGRQCHALALRPSPHKRCR